MEQTVIFHFNNDQMNTLYSKEPISDLKLTESLPRDFTVFAALYYLRHAGIHLWVVHLLSVMKWLNEMSIIPE